MEINFRLARYMNSAFKCRELPADVGAEVAFVGRSNAGKSSALNALAGVKRLAHTSKTPGRTQTMNSFALTDDARCRLVDLPGFGYAKVSKQMMAHWGTELVDYFHQRQSLCGVILLMDIRHPLQERDERFFDLIVETDVPVHVLLTKADKLKRGACARTFCEVKAALKMYSGDVSVQVFSSMSLEGLELLQRQLIEWMGLREGG